MVMRLPERDQLSVSREKMHADIAVAMGGRIAEEMFLVMIKLPRARHRILTWLQKWQKIW